MKLIKTLLSKAKNFFVGLSNILLCPSEIDNRIMEQRLKNYQYGSWM